MLVNNAGSAVRGPLMQSPVEDLSHTLDLNVKATVLLTRLLAPRIAKRGSGVSALHPALYLFGWGRCYYCSDRPHRAVLIVFCSTNCTLLTLLHCTALILILIPILIQADAFCSWGPSLPLGPVPL